MFLAEVPHRLARDTVRLLVDNGYANEQTRPHWGPPLPSSRRRVLKCLQIFNRLFRLRLARVVRIDFNRTDTTLVDYDRPGIGTVPLSSLLPPGDRRRTGYKYSGRPTAPAQAELVRISVSRVVQRSKERSFLSIIVWFLSGVCGVNATSVAPRASIWSFTACKAYSSALQ